MSRRSALIATLGVILLIALSGPAMAGGYAVVHLDEDPGDVLVATPWRFGFVVLQHDVTPNSDVTPIVRALHKDSGDEVTATGVQQGAIGHFVVEVTFPRAGEWKWSIEPRPYAETSFATLTVIEPEPRSVRRWPASPWERYWLKPDKIIEQQRAATTERGATRTVAILDPWVFAPSSLQVPPGTTVTWVNRTATIHAVTGNDLAFDDSGPIAPGQSFSTTFEQPGTYRYRCGPHPGMMGEIIVA
jgi:plastocyanin